MSINGQEAQRPPIHHSSVLHPWVAAANYSLKAGAVRGAPPCCKERSPAPTGLLGGRLMEHPTGSAWCVYRCIHKKDAAAARGASPRCKGKAPAAIGLVGGSWIAGKYVCGMWTDAAAG